MKGYIVIAILAAFLTVACASKHTEPTYPFTDLLKYAQQECKAKQEVDKEVAQAALLYWSFRKRSVQSKLTNCVLSNPTDKTTCDKLRMDYIDANFKYQLMLSRSLGID